MLHPLQCKSTVSSGGLGPSLPSQRRPGDFYVLIAGLSWLPGTAASAALKPVFEWVPSQKGLVVEPPQRQRAKGRFVIG